MTLNQEILYWDKDPQWYFFDKESDDFYCVPEAPERVIQSMKMWKEHRKKHTGYRDPDDPVYTTDVFLNRKP